MSPWRKSRGCRISLRLSFEPGVGERTRSPRIGGREARSGLCGKLGREGGIERRREGRTVQKQPLNLHLCLVFTIRPVNNLSCKLVWAGW